MKLSQSLCRDLCCKIKVKEICCSLADARTRCGQGKKRKSVLDVIKKKSWAALQALLHSARDQSEIQLRNTAIQALQPPSPQAGTNPRVSTRFWERDVYVAGSNGGQFRDNFRVPVFQAFPANVQPVNPSDYLPTQTDAFDATWVPRFTVIPPMPGNSIICP